MVKVNVEKAEEPENKSPTAIGSEKKQENSRKTSTSASLKMLKAMCGSQQTVENSSRDRNIRPPYLRLRNLYSGQEATVRTGHVGKNWKKFPNWKEVHQGCLLLPCLLNLYAEYVMWNARLDEAQAGIKTTRRNINNLRYADDTTLMAEIKE